MKSEEFYLEQAAPPGSAFYYSVSHLKGDVRQAVLALQAYYLQLVDVVYQTNDANVAQVKLPVRALFDALMSLDKLPHISRLPGFEP